MTHIEPFFDHLAEACLFCDPTCHGQAGQILVRSDHFYLFAGLGAIVDGYIIITPYRCDDPSGRLRSLADMSPALADEFTFLSYVVSTFYRDTYGPDFTFFEHGRAGSCLIPRGDTPHCFHAHLCCYPAGYSLWLANLELPVKTLSGLHELPRVTRGSRYLYMEHGRQTGGPELRGRAGGSRTAECRVALLPDDAELQSQHLRRLFAAAVGDPAAWHWREQPRVAAAERLVAGFAEWLAGARWLAPRLDSDDLPRIEFAEALAHANRLANDQIAEQYQRAWQGRELVRDIGRFLARLPEHEDGARPRVLDAGCGPGQYARALAGLGIEVVGIDQSARMLDLGRKVVAPLGTAAVELREGRLENLDDPALGLADAEFDAIWFSAALVHVPRSLVPRVLAGMKRILRDDGSVYLSTQVGSGMRFEDDGRIFVLFERDELAVFLHEAGFEIVEEWTSESRRTTSGKPRLKRWLQLLLRKRAPHLSAGMPAGEPTLSALGEHAILARIRERFAHADQHILIGIGDDAAVFHPPPGQVLVATTDPCPRTALSLLGEPDMAVDGWFTVTINLSDLAAMGASPLGLLLAIEAPDEMPLERLEAFWDGVAAASQAFGCPILGGNLTEGPRFQCVGTALGAVDPARMLRRDRARPGEHVVVIGDPGRFWTGALARLYDVPLTEEERAEAEGPLRRPIPRIVEGRLLAERGLARCAMDSSDGLTACFHALARASGEVDLHVDLAALRPTPLLDRLARRAGLEPEKLMLSWGGWELVCTVADEHLAAVEEALRGLGTRFSVLGWVRPGAGRAWLHHARGACELPDFGNTKFSPSSHNRSGLTGYLDFLRATPLIAGSGEPGGAR